MSALRQDKVLVDCPHCGHQQREPHGVFSTVCQKCRQHISVEQSLKPARKRAACPAELAPAQKHVTCFDCGAELEVAISAESTMCKRCGRYVDLKDYHITSAVSKNFKTKGAFVLETKGYVFNTEAIVGDAVLKGRFLGKLDAERSLTIYSTAIIKGSFKTGNLIIPAANHFLWSELLTLGGAEISGELVANLRVTGTVIFKSTARFFGDVAARNLVVEAGAVVVGSLRIGSKR
ncbi:MAG: polymer-forming cytoskeletal protein [Verrucomicrobia bacterium]|nr:polymer-forming cytoskeletal protein [Verrucomicrobiota bacterium]